MDLRHLAGNLLETSADVLAITCFGDPTKDTVIKAINTALGGIVLEAAASESGEVETHGRVHFNALGKADELVLRDLVEKHLRYTGSVRAKEILDNWPHYLPKFVKVMPTEYRRALQEIAAQQVGAQFIAPEKVS